MLRRVVVACALAVSAGACGLQVAGTAPGGGDAKVPPIAPDAGPDSMPPPADAGMDVSEEPAPPQPCSTPPGACAAAVPMGWSVVAWAASPPSACPVTFTQTDTITAPVAGAGTCECGCTITTEPCVVGALPTYYSSNMSCGTQGVTVNVSGTACTSLGFSGSLSNYYKSPALPLGGACTGAAVVDATKVTKTPARACAPPQQCLEDVCTGKAPSGFASCIQSDGDVACPAGPFTKRTLVMADVNVTCSACGTCSVGGQCTNPRIRFYSDGSCQNEVANLPSDDTCASTGGGGTVSHFRYEVTVQNKACVATGAKMATLTPTGSVTVCCR